MIVGNGVLANALKSADSEELLIFASGVSNSLETNNLEFNRELNLLKKNIEDFPEMKLIYFSTCSVYDGSKQESKYVLHKLNMEKYVQENAKKYLILRVGNAVGKGGNPNTLFNFLKNKIVQKEEFLLHTNARRILIDVADIALFVKEKQKKLENTTRNLAFPYQYSLREIVGGIQEIHHNNPLYKEISEGDFYDVEFDEELKSFFSTNSSNEYLMKLILKYF